MSETEEKFLIDDEDAAMVAGGTGAVKYIYCCVTKSCKNYNKMQKVLLPRKGAVVRCSSCNQVMKNCGKA